LRNPKLQNPEEKRKVLQGFVNRHGWEVFPQVFKKGSSALGGGGAKTYQHKRSVRGNGNANVLFEVHGPDEEGGQNRCADIEGPYLLDGKNLQDGGGIGIKLTSLADRRSWNLSGEIGEGGRPLIGREPNGPVSVNAHAKEKAHLRRTANVRR